MHPGLVGDLGYSIRSICGGVLATCRADKIQSVPEVVLPLHLQPEIRRGAKRRRRPQRHSRRDARVTIQYVGQRCPRHAQTGRRLLQVIVHENRVLACE
jgi:hypothetical protein